MVVLAIPEAIRSYLEGLIRQRMADRDPDAVIAALPEAVEEGVVLRLVGGGPFGWLLDARLDRTPDGAVLEVLEDSRMAGPEHYAVHDNGHVEELENEHTTMVFPAGATPEQEEQVRQRFYEHNGRVQQLLQERGFRS